MKFLEEDTTFRAIFLTAVTTHEGSPITGKKFPRRKQGWNGMS